MGYETTTFHTMLAQTHAKPIDIILLIVALLILAGTAGPARAQDTAGHVAIVESVVTTTSVSVVAG